MFIITDGLKLTLVINQCRNLRWIKSQKLTVFYQIESTYFINTDIPWYHRSMYILVALILQKWQENDPEQRVSMFNWCKKRHMIYLKSYDQRPTMWQNGTISLNCFPSYFILSLAQQKRFHCNFDTRCYMYIINMNIHTDDKYVTLVNEYDINILKVKKNTTNITIYGKRYNWSW